MWRHAFCWKRNLCQNRWKSLEKCYKNEVWRECGRLLGNTWLHVCCTTLLDTSAVAFRALFDNVANFLPNYIKKSIEILLKMKKNRGLEGVWAALERFLASGMLRGASGHLCGSISCALWRHLGALGGVLGGSGVHLGASWAVSGGVLALLVASRGALGTILGPS